MGKKLFRCVTQMTPDIYRDFYKLYYRERLKAFNIISIAVAVFALLAALIFQSRGAGAVWTALALWVCLFFIVYPRMAYRKPYKRDKDKKQTTYFSFYETYVDERTNGETSSYDYESLMRVIETDRYIVIFHTWESVSIVVKSEVKSELKDGGALSELMKNKTNYKKLRK